jgi:LPXTG-motif cell wall-anchored protein
MSIHEGDWLGKEIKPFYILVLGLGLGLIIISGLLLFFRKNKSPR